MSSSPPPTNSFSISPGEDADSVINAARALIAQHKWRLCKNGKGLEREFRFKGFKAAWDFMNAVAAECKKAKHHPEWSNVYSKTHIRWTTHSPEGLSSKDTRMAAFCDEAGRQFGELESGEGGSAGTPIRVQAGDCCTPKGNNK